jgi:hypothetical protein
VRVPDGFLRSRHRVAAGQRFYVIEPLDASAALALGATVGPMTRAALRRLEVTRSWTTIDRRRSRVVVGIYLSEAEAQEVAAAIRQGRGPAALLQAIVAAYRTRPGGLARRHFRRRLRGWALGALARWARTGAEAFARAAADPASGVTVRVEMSAVPGLDSAPGIGITGAIPVASAIRGTPSVAVTVTAGRLAR